MTRAISVLSPLLLSFALGWGTPRPARAGTEVVGGQVSKTCAFPGVTKPASPMSYGNRLAHQAQGILVEDFYENYEKVQLCSGTLVHPRVVVYAAHCLKAGYLRLGEDRNGPLFTQKDGHFEKSNVNPRWMSPGQVSEDWAYLLLKEPIKGVPLIPLAYGCELDMLIKSGAPVVMAGYSDNEEGLPEDKRDYRQKWARTKIRDASSGVINAGGSGVVACKGDSGGPLLAQVPDGSWRMIGIASTRSGSSCDSPGAFNRYSRVSKAMVSWLEQETGLDLTPCFDLDGKPTPSAACDAFMAYAGDPSAPTGEWSNNCADAKVRPAKDACGIEDSGEEPEPEDKGDREEGGDKDDKGEDDKEDKDGEGENDKGDGDDKGEGEDDDKDKGEDDEGDGDEKDDEDQGNGKDSGEDPEDDKERDAQDPEASTDQLRDRGGCALGAQHLGGWSGLLLLTGLWTRRRARVQ